MSIVSTTGIGSGIDINSLVTQLVKTEGQPALNAIQRQQDAANARLSGLGTLKSALSDFQAIVAKLKDGSLDRVADIYRVVFIRVKQADDALDQVIHITKTARLLPIAINSQRLAFYCLL